VAQIAVALGWSIGFAPSDVDAFRRLDAERDTALAL
jgi:hypothetical protein